MEILTEYLSKGFVTMLLISMPCVLVAAAIGLVVGILQAVTQVQEQTIAAAPKILGVFLIIMIMGMGFIKLLTNLIQEGSVIAFNIVPKNETYALSADYYKYTRPFSSEMNWDTINKKNGVNEIMKNPGKVPWSDKQSKSEFHGAQRPNPTPDLMEKKKIIGR